MRTPYLAPTREAGRRWDIGGQGSTRSGRREKIRPGAGTSETYVDETFPVGSVVRDYAIPSKSCDDSIRGENYAEKGRDQHDASVEDDDDHCSVGLRDNVGLYVGLAVIGRFRWSCGGDRIRRCGRRFVPAREAGDGHRSEDEDRQDPGERRFG
jgi:hypothetical protein